MVYNNMLAVSAKQTANNIPSQEMMQDADDDDWEGIISSFDTVETVGEVVGWLVEVIGNIVGDITVGGAGLFVGVTVDTASPHKPPG